jgi:lipoprotein-anchoring transpeptidase ErfK/SrfK
MRKFVLAAAAAALLVSTPAEAERLRCGDLLTCLFGTPRHRDVPAGLPTRGIKDQYGHPVNLSGASRRETVDWNEDRYPVGSIIVKTGERALYYVSGEGEAERYAIGVGREGFQWSGTSKIAAKSEWPGWTPPPEMIKREALKGHHLPDHMDGGPGNPLGARAMYLAGRMYRIHGTNNEASIGGAVSSGCIRMMNADVIDLYNRVKIGARVWVYQ